MIKDKKKMSNNLIELGVSTAGSFAISTAVSAEPLLTALITFGVSIVTLVGSELIKLAVAFLKNKRKKYEDETEEKKDNK